MLIRSVKPYGLACRVALNARAARELKAKVLNTSSNFCFKARVEYECLPMGLQHVYVGKAL